MLALQPADLEALRSDIRELHLRGNDQRALLGHPPAPCVEDALRRHDAPPANKTSTVRMTTHSLSRLSHLRDQKAAELQLLMLRKTGRSAASLQKAAPSAESPSWPGSRFNARALLATIDALAEQHEEIQQQTRTSQKLQRENRKLAEEASLLRHALSLNGQPRPSTQPVKRGSGTRLPGGETTSLSASSSTSKVDDTTADGTRQAATVATLAYRTAPQLRCSSGGGNGMSSSGAPNGAANGDGASKDYAEELQVLRWQHADHCAELQALRQQNAMVQKGAGAKGGGRGDGTFKHQAEVMPRHTPSCGMPSSTTLPRVACHVRPSTTFRDCSLQIPEFTPMCGRI